MTPSIRNSNQAPHNFPYVYGSPGVHASGSLSPIGDPPVEEYELLPTECPEDLLRLELYKQGLIDRSGKLRPSVPLMPLPPFDAEEIDSIVHLLTNSLQMADKEVKLTIGLSVKDFLDDLLKRAANHHILVSRIEVVGGAAAKMLGLLYCQKALSALGMKNSDRFITEDLLKGRKRKLPDIDIRIHTPLADQHSLNVLKKEVPKSLASFKTQSVFEQHQLSEHIQKFGLQKCYCIYEKEVKYSIVGIGSTAGTGVELLFVQQLSRQHLFLRDAFRIRIDGLLHALNNPRNAIAIAPESDYANGWQSLIDLLTGMVSDNHPDTIDANGWPMLISHLTRGRYCPDKGFAELLFKNFEKSVPDPSHFCCELGKLLSKCFKNHHADDPFAGICLTFNACLSWPNASLQDYAGLWAFMLPALKTGLAALVPATFSEKLLLSICKAVEESPNHFSKVSAILELHAFNSLSLGGNIIQTDEPQYLLRTNGGKPVIEVRFEIRGNSCSLVLPFCPQTAFELLEKEDPSKIKGPLQDLIEILDHASRPQPFQSDSHTQLKKYLRQLPFNPLELGLKAVRFLRLNPLGNAAKFLIFNTLTACLQAGNSPVLKEAALTHYPLLLFEAHHSGNKEKVARAIGSCFPERPDRFSISGAIHTLASDHIDSLVRACSRWIAALAALQTADSAIAAKTLPVYLSLLSNSEKVLLADDLFHSLPRIHSNLSISLWHTMLKEPIEDPSLKWKWAAQLAAGCGTTAKNSAVQTSFLLNVCSALTEFCTHPPLPVPKSLLPEFSQTFHSVIAKLLELGHFEKPNLLLGLAAKYKIVQSDTLADLWVACCRKQLEKQGALKAVQTWDEAMRHQAWPEKHRGREWEALLLDITDSINSLEANLAKSMEKPFLALCLQREFDAELKKKMKGIAERHAKRLILHTRPQKALQDIKDHFAGYLEPNSLFILHVNAFHTELEKENLPQAFSLLKDILSMDSYEARHASRRKLVTVFIEKLLGSILSKNIGWHINAVCQILQNPSISAIFEGAIPERHRLIELTISACLDACPGQLKTVIYSLLANYIELCFKVPNGLFEPPYFTRKCRFLTATLQHLQAPAFIYPPHLASLLASHANEWIEYALKSPAPSACIDILTIFMTHKIPIELTETNRNLAFEKLLSYLENKGKEEARPDCSATCQGIERARTVNQLVVLLNTSQGKRETLPPLLALELYAQLATTFIVNNSPMQAIRWINRVLDLEAKHPSEWHGTMPPHLITWASGLLPHPSEHNKCIEILAFMKARCKTVHPQLPHLFFALLEDRCLKKDPVTKAGILVEEQQLLTSAIPQNKLEEKARKLMPHLLKEPASPSKVLCALQILNCFSIPDDVLWQKTFERASALNNEDILKAASNLYFSHVEDTQKVRLSDETFASCFNSFLEILGKLQNPRILKYFSNLPANVASYPSKLNVLRDQMLELLFKHAASSAVFFKDEETLEKLILKIKDELDQNAGIDPPLQAKLNLVLAEAISNTDNFPIFKLACSRFHRSLSTQVLPEASNTIIRLLAQAVRFKETHANEAAVCVARLTANLPHLERLDIFQALDSLSSFTHFSILSDSIKAVYVRLLASDLEEEPAAAYCQNSHAGLMSLLVNTLLQKHTILFQGVTSCMNSPSIKRWISEKDYQSLVRWIIPLRLANVSETYDQELFENELYTVVKQIPFILQDLTTSDRCIDLFLHTLLEYLRKFESGESFTKISIYFFDKLERVRKDALRVEKKESAAAHRCIAYYRKYMEQLLNYPKANLSMAKFLLESCKALIELILTSIPEEELIVQIFYQFVFSPLAETDNSLYPPHLLTSQMLAKKMIDRRIFDRHIPKLFELDLYIDIDTPKKFFWGNSHQQVEIFLTLFRKICSGSPYKLWHAIEMLSRLGSHDVFESTPNALICCYAEAIKALGEHMSYHVGGMPIYEHLHQKILNDSWLQKKDPQWQEACIHIYNMFTHALQKRCLYGPERPQEIPAQYEPLDFLSNVLAKALFNGVFDDKHEEYLRLTSHLFIPAIEKMKKNPSCAAKYSKHIFKMLTFTNARAKPLSFEARHASSCRQLNWIEALSNSGLAEAVVQAKLLVSVLSDESKELFSKISQFKNN